MSEITEFLKSKQKKDFPWGVDLYKRCGGQPVIIAKLTKEGFSKANWQILRYELNKFKNKKVVPAKGKIIHHKFNTITTVKKIDRKPAKIVKHPSSAEKEGLKTIQKKNETNQDSIASTANYITDWVKQWKAPSWLNCIRELFRSGKTSTDAGKS